ncbi:MAG: MATE family efflux transporter [Bacteroidetes bacterium]|nr:MAG: MATE family efflux transporter [Bacteroidota bacterium]
MNKSILRLAIPNIISNITVPLLGMADLAILGHLEGSPEAYIGAIALGGMIFNFIYAIFSFLRMGTTGFTAQAFGAGDTKELGLIFGRAMLVAISGGLFLIMVQVPIDWFTFSVISSSDAVEAGASEYFYIRIWAAPATLGLLALNGWFLGMQNARAPMFLAILINLLNVGANYIFVYGLGMKSDGVAWGTLIAQYVGLIAAIVILIRYYGSILKQINRRAMLQMNALRRFFTVNRDIMIRTVLLILALSLFTTSSAKMGDDTLAVNTLLLQFFFLFSYFLDGFAYAAESLAGKFYGAKDLPSLRKFTKYIFVWGGMISLPVGLAYLLGGRYILYILTDNVDVISNSLPYLPWLALVPLVSFVAFIWDGIYTGCTATAAMRNTMIIATLLVFIPLNYLLLGPMGNHGLWLALMLFMATRSIFMTIYAPKSIYAIKY